MGHAGEVETSMLLHLFPTMVNSTMISQASSDSSDIWGSPEQGAKMKYDVDEFTKNGVVGNPSLASIDFGEKLLKESGKSLAKLMDTVSKLDIS